MSQTLLINPSAFEAGLEAAFAARSRTSEAQAAAFKRFARLGLPNRKVEGWKWSDFNAALRRLEPVDEAERDAGIAPSPFETLDPIEIRIANGRVEPPKEDLPPGVRWGVIDSVATIPELESHAIASLNVAMTRKAFGVEIFDDVELKRPILIRHVNAGAGFSFAQTLLRVGRRAKVDVIETCEGEGAGFYSHLNHAALRDGGRLRRFVLQDAGPSNITHGICAVKLDKGARLEQTGLSTGGRLCRHETHAHFWGEGASARLDSAALLSNERHSDFTSEVLHIAEGCETRQRHKGVAADRGRSVFQGRFHVRRGAQKTDAKMTANALLLSETAEANHKPELEIYADDVECAHGSTSGALDADALFYLRQRGLDEHAARALLIEAFVGEVIDAIGNEAVRDVFRARVGDWLEAA